jgi:hypothetical protein
MEVYYAQYSANTIARLLNIAKRYDLIPCGGSDYHALGNTGEQVPGTMGPPLESVERLEKFSRNLRKSLL